jgi:hypothetical protein
MTLHELLDFQYGPDGDATLQSILESGEDSNLTAGELAETPIHVATRRFQTRAVEILLDHGADIDAKNAGEKTAYVHAVRRGFGELADLLLARGASVELNDADRLAVALVTGNLDGARDILEEHPETARTGNPEEDRLLADLTGRNKITPVALLISAGADLTAPALDTGTPLHQAGCFGPPANARLLIEAGAPRSGKTCMRNWRRYWSEPERDSSTPRAWPPKRVISTDSFTMPARKCKKISRKRGNQIFVACCNGASRGSTWWGSQRSASR